MAEAVEHYVVSISGEEQATRFDNVYLAGKYAQTLADNKRRVVRVTLETEYLEVPLLVVSPRPLSETRAVEKAQTLLERHGYRVVAPGEGGV